MNQHIKMSTVNNFYKLNRDVLKYLIEKTANVPTIVKIGNVVSDLRTEANFKRFETEYRNSVEVTITCEGLLALFNIACVCKMMRSVVENICLHNKNLTKAIIVLFGNVNGIKINVDSMKSFYFNMGEIASSYLFIQIIRKIDQDNSLSRVRENGWYDCLSLIREKGITYRSNTLKPIFDDYYLKYILFIEEGVDNILPNDLLTKEGLDTVNEIKNIFKKEPLLYHFYGLRQRSGFVCSLFFSALSECRCKIYLMILKDCYYATINGNEHMKTGVFVRVIEIVLKSFMDHKHTPDCKHFNSTHNDWFECGLTVVPYVMMSCIEKNIITREKCDVVKRNDC